MSDTICERKGGIVDLTLDQRAFVVGNDRTYECRVLLCPEEEGGFSAHALRLPGVVSEGETADEAIANIKDAFQAVIEVYLDSGEPIPWKNIEIEKPRGSVERWILVDV